MYNADCSFYKIRRYQIDNSRWQGIVTDTLRYNNRTDCTKISGSEGKIKGEIDLLIQMFRKYDSVIKKMQVELCYDEEDKLRTIKIYIIVSYYNQTDVSSYWIRQMECFPDASLLNQEMLGSILEEFSYLPKLEQEELWSIENKRNILLTPECVHYLITRTILQREGQLYGGIIDSKKEMLENIDTGAYITRILTHSVHDDKIYFYGGLSFEIKKGRRKRVYWTSMLSLKISDFQSCVVFSRDMCRIESRMYPWMFIKKDNTT